jgi:hypothetical protein
MRFFVMRSLVNISVVVFSPTRVRVLARCPPDGRRVILKTRRQVSSRDARNAK